MSLQILTAIFINLNLVSLWNELPSLILAFTFSLVIFGYFFRHHSWQKPLKIILLFLVIISLRVSFQKVSSAEAAISFVLMLSALKFWELESFSDHFNMFLILCLAEAGVFLLNPSFTVFLFGSIKIFFYFYYILKIQNYDLSSLSIKRLFILIVPSIVFAFVLFYTFPRFTQGFLNTATNFNIQQTGSSNNIDIRNLGPLNLSSKKVFKVYLQDSKLKASPDLYWRQSVLWDYFDGEWRSGERNLEIKDLSTYSIMPSNLGALKVVFSDGGTFEYITPNQYQGFIIEEAGQPKTNYFSDRTIRSRIPFKPLEQYNLLYGEASLRNYIEPLMLKKATKLRMSENSVTAIKKKYFNNISSSDTEDVVLQKLKTNYLKNNFSYSLSPPSYRSDEDFLLNGKLGYCSHFASSFAILSRIAGLPTRLVSGYLGSEYNAFDNSLIVKELDAHVWLEIYLKDRGWIHFDPTELVTPDRLLLSASDFNEIQVGGIGFPKIPFLASAGMWLDALNSKFNETIFGYDRSAQEEFFNLNSLKNIKPQNLFIICFILFGLIYFIYLTYFKTPKAKHLIRYHHFLKLMREHQLIKMPHETALAFRDRCLENESISHDLVRQETELFIINHYQNKN